MTKKVLFFSDAGIDDAIALILARFSNEIEVIGAVADYGNVSKEIASKNLYYLIHEVGGIPIPLIGGAESPLTSAVPTFYPEVHGVHGLGPIIPKENKNAKKLENFFEVVKLIQRYKDELVIVNTGRLTSLAVLFVLYKDLMKEVKSYYIMGGSFLHPGNVTTVAEANFYVDPVAANLVFTYAQNVSVYPLNVTQYALITPKMVNYVDAKGKSKLTKPLLDHYYYNFYKKLFPKLEGSPVHDLMPFMALLDDKMFTYHHSPIYVNTEDLSRGESIADFRSSIKEAPFIDRPTQRIAIDFDYSLFFKHYMSIMTDEAF